MREGTPDNSEEQAREKELERLIRARDEHVAEANREIEELARTGPGFKTMGVGLFLILLGFFFGVWSMYSFFELWWMFAGSLFIILIGIAFVTEGSEANDRSGVDARERIEGAHRKAEYARKVFDSRIAEVKGERPPSPYGISFSRAIPQAVKIAVAIRDEGQCVVCGSDEDLQYDHIIPFSRGGESGDPDNIQLLCGSCNRAKGNRWIG